MNFIIVNKKFSNNNKRFKNTIELSLQYFLFHDTQYIRTVENNASKIIILGDIIPQDKYDHIDKLLPSLLNDFSPDKILSQGGHFYFIRIIKATGAIEIYSSFLNILPVYYLNSETIISSSVLCIKKFSENAGNVSKQFILQKMFFNYPFFDDTIFEKIKLLPAHSFIKLEQNTLKIEDIADVTEYFSEKPDSWKEKKEFLIELFLKRLNKYIPDKENPYISFTGGFDGRTIVAGGMNLGKVFNTYSFGTHDSADVVIPARNAKNLGIEFHPFFLDDRDYLEKSYEYGMNLVDSTDGMANFARAHYVFAAKEIAGDSKYIITGNFGSELFRAFHNTGVVVSPLMYQLFAVDDFKQIVNNLSSSLEYGILNKEVFKKEIKHLTERLAEEHKNIHQSNDINKIFYKYIFEEVFRKYFGAELKMQSEFIVNRTPYLDPGFVREVLKTDIAGIHSRFYENNPVKRYKGQLFYAEFIKKFNPDIYKYTSGKGYAPADLLTLSGRWRIIYSYIQKKMKKNTGNPDPFGVSQVLRHNFDSYLSLKDNSHFFDMKAVKELITNDGWSKNIFINVFSLLWLMNNHYDK